MNRTLTLLALSFALSVNKCVSASPLYATDMSKLCLFPHLVGIADFICSGTALSTNDGFSAGFAIDEILWGIPPPTTNVTIRNLTQRFGLNCQPGERYLLCAFTNNWWAGGREGYRQSFLTLSHYLPATNRPSSSIFSDDYRIIDKNRCMIPFRFLDYGGTNYWEGTRTLITNLIDIGRIQCDEGKVRAIVESIVNDVSNSRRLPVFVQKQMILYKNYRYDGKDQVKPCD